MIAQLHHMMIQRRSAELRRADERARFATEAPARRRTSHDRDTRPSGERRRGSTALEIKRTTGGAR
jgi:hypothetical protein